MGKLMDFSARKYDPNTGSFVSVDRQLALYPGQHSYHYSYHDPVNVMDPSGLGETTHQGNAVGSRSGLNNSPVLKAKDKEFDQDFLMHVFDGRLRLAAKAAGQGNLGANNGSPIANDPEKTKREDGNRSLKDGSKLAEDDGGPSPWQVGWEWLTGTGPKQRVFTDGEFLEMLKQHDHIEETRELVKTRLRKGERTGQNNYSLAGVEGVGKYLLDYSTLLTVGLLGNLAVTYLGSYSLAYVVTSVTGNMATVRFTVADSSSIESATHPPVVGYSSWWSDHIGKPLNAQFSSGPMSLKTQTFIWTESILWK